PNSIPLAAANPPRNRRRFIEHSWHMVAPCNVIGMSYEFRQFGRRLRGRQVLRRRNAAGGSPAAGHFPCAAKESNQRKAAPVSRPLFSGSPCAACLDVATEQLDLARHTKR